MNINIADKPLFDRERLTDEEWDALLMKVLNRYRKKLEEIEG